MASDLLPPGPRSPAVAQTLRYLSDPLGLMRACAVQFGDLFTIQLAGVGKLVLVSSPEHVNTLVNAPSHVVAEATHKVFGPVQRRYVPSDDDVRAQGSAMRRNAERVVSRWRAGMTFPLLAEAEQITDDEATRLALAWVLECVLGRPDVSRRLVSELRETDDIARLVYLDAVIHESLRVRPIVATGVTRIVRTTFRIGGYALPEGTYVAACVPELHRRAELYAEPDVFRPERFLDRERGLHELGSLVALYELKVVLVTLLSRARLELACRDVRARARGFFLAPEAGLPVSYLGPAI